MRTDGHVEANSRFSQFCEGAKLLLSHRCHIKVPLLTL